MIKQNLFDKAANAQHVLISIVIYIILGQLIYVLPQKLLQEYLVSHTIVCILLLVTINYMKLYYKPNQRCLIRFDRLVGYCLAGLILCVIANYPHNILSKYHAKPSEYFVFLNYGFVGKMYFLFLLGLVGPLLEEIYYRKYIFNIIKDEFGLSAGVIASAFLYMILHDFRIHIVYLFIPGIIYALIYNKTNTIYAGVFVHGLNNLIWFMLIYYA